MKSRSVELTSILHTTRPAPPSDGLAPDPRRSGHARNGRHGVARHARRDGRRRQAGGTVIGIAIGLLVGLLIAVAAAVFMTRSSVPFVNKVQRPAERPELPEGEVPDPNRAQSGRQPDAAAPPPAAVLPAPGAPPGAAEAPAAAAPQASVAPPSDPGAAPPAATDRPSYLLQAGAFKGQEDADSMRAKLALIGFEARIVSAEVNGTTFYRVRVGPYAQLEDMNRARSRLAENGIEASVVRQR